MKKHEKPCHWCGAVGNEEHGCGVNEVDIMKLEIKKAIDKYPMTGKSDKQASYKNGWYDCAYHLFQTLKGIL